LLYAGQLLCVLGVQAHKSLKVLLPGCLQDTLDETLPDTLHMTGIYLMILLTSLAIVTTSIYYYAIMTGALILAFFMMQVSVHNVSTDAEQGWSMAAAPLPASV
jgi:hypothetical protein